MPLFPSQDSLHLYCVEVFRQLSAHHPDPYAQTYSLTVTFPPSLYYSALSRWAQVMVSDGGEDYRLRVLHHCPVGTAFPGAFDCRLADWTPLLLMPVLLGSAHHDRIVNFWKFSALGFSCFALATWLRNQTRPGLRPRIAFLLWLVLILLTHPVPWRPRSVSSIWA